MLSNNEILKEIKLKLEEVEIEIKDEYGNRIDGNDYLQKLFYEAEVLQKIINMIEEN